MLIWCVYSRILCLGHARVVPQFIELQCIVASTRQIVPAVKIGMCRNRRYAAAARAELPGRGDRDGLPVRAVSGADLGDDHEEVAGKFRDSNLRGVFSGLRE